MTLDDLAEKYKHKPHDLYYRGGGDFEEILCARCGKYLQLQEGIFQINHKNIADLSERELYCSKFVNFL